MSRKIRIILLFFVGILVVFVDQYTKQLIRNKMEMFESIEVVSDYFNITYLMNPGGAFGMFADYSAKFRFLFFIVISTAALGAFVYIFFKNKVEKDYYLISSMTLIVGGAIGNLIDRVRFGEVVDFLHFYIGEYSWPPFNVADSAITVGMVLFVIHSLRASGEKEKIADPVRQ